MMYVNEGVVITIIGATGKRAANKQAKWQGNAKEVPTEQPKAQKHAQPANVRPISKQKRTETIKEYLPSNQKRKNMHNRQTCGQ